jgi:hypothetical protein
VDKWTPEEYERRLASWEEDVRVLEAQLEETRAEAEFLRKQGHDFPAEVMEHSIKKAEEMIATAYAQLNEE